MKKDLVQRNTKQRRIVWDAVMGRCDHPTVDQIYDEIHERYPGSAKAPYTETCASFPKTARSPMCAFRRRTDMTAVWTSIII